MSEKITFKELIESIAEETDNSRQYTQDFVKNFVEVINEGLEEDGKVNIAGFGKFNLKRVDEREGFNPQTEEKITIPAHNKIIFKPYKKVRELVNAPYAHLEPELLKEETKEDQSSIEEGSTDPTNSKQNDFIPTGPPTSKTQNENEVGNLSNSAQEEEDEDIVEFKPGSSSTDEEIDEELDEFLGSSEQSDDQNENENESYVDDEGDQQDEIKEESELIEETIFQTEELIEDSEELLDSFEDEDAKEESTTTVDFQQNNKPAKKSSSSLPLTITAVVILLLTAGGIWYFSVNPDESQPGMIAQETISPSENVASTSDDQSQSGEELPNDEQQSSQEQQQQSQDQTQSQNQSSGSSSTTETSGAVTSENKSEGVEIEQGQTLWSLADEKYGNPRLWPWIYGKNDALKDPDLIYAGSSLSVPLPSGPNNSLNTADSVGVAKGFIATYQWYKDKNSSKAKDHLWGAKVYHDDIRSIANVEIDKADLKYANRAR